MSDPTKHKRARRPGRAPRRHHPELESVLLSRAFEGATTVLGGARRVSHLAVDVVTAAARPLRRLARMSR